MSALAALVAGSPDAPQVGGQEPVRQVVPATALPARTERGPVEPEAAQETGELPATPVPEPEVSVRAATASHPTQTAKASSRKLARGRAARRTAKARASVRARDKASSDEAGSPLLDVGAFERERKRKD